MNRKLHPLLTPIVILAALGLACLLTLLTLAWLGFSASLPGADPGFVPANLTVIPASTSTPIATPSPTPNPFQVGTPTIPADQIHTVRNLLTVVGGKTVFKSPQY